jgi:tetratricopeptide (TPR) repeat protein
MKTIDFSYFIERYNAGEMNESEKQWFQKELEGNKQLFDEVNLRKHTDEILQKQNIISLRNKLSDIEKERGNIVLVRKREYPGFLKYAALFAGLVIIGSIIMFSRANLSNEEIFDQYYKSYEPPTSQRSELSEKNADFTLALEFYRTQDYEKAVIFFNKVIKSSPNDMQSELLNGVSNFETKRYPEAKRSFFRVIDDNNNLFIEEAKWYLALCYVKTDEKAKAIQQLEIIKREGGIYKDNAKKILRKLK